MKTVGIIGGSGYTGGELIRLVINHPALTLEFVYSTTRAETPITDIHQDLLGQLDLRFTDKVNENIDVLFLCLGHGNSAAFLAKNSLASSTIIIDLSNDFRLQKDAQYGGRTFVYGYPKSISSESRRPMLLPIRAVLPPPFSWPCCLWRMPINSVIVFI